MCIRLAHQPKHKIDDVSRVVKFLYLVSIFLPVGCKVGGFRIFSKELNIC